MKDASDLSIQYINESDNPPRRFFKLINPLDKTKSVLLIKKLLESRLRQVLRNWKIHSDIEKTEDAITNEVSMQYVPK